MAINQIDRVEKMVNAHWSKNQSAWGENIRWFAGSFADRLNRQMGLSDLESSRDSLVTYNCHRRVNEHSLVECASQKILLFLPTVPFFVPFFVHLVTHSFASFSIMAIVVLSFVSRVWFFDSLCGSGCLLLASLLSAR